MKKVTMKDVESQKGRGMNKVNERFQREWKSRQKELNASIDKVKKADKKGVTDKVADKVKKSGLDINKNKEPINGTKALNFKKKYFKLTICTSCLILTIFKLLSCNIFFNVFLEK